MYCAVQHRLVGPHVVGSTPCCYLLQTVVDCAGHHTLALPAYWQYRSHFQHTTSGAAFASAVTEQAISHKHIHLSILCTATQTAETCTMTRPPQQQTQLLPAVNATNMLCKSPQTSAARSNCKSALQPWGPSCTVTPRSTNPLTQQWPQRTSSIRPCLEYCVNDPATAP